MCAGAVFPKAIIPQSGMDFREPEGNLMEAQFSEDSIRTVERQCRGIGGYGYEYTYTSLHLYMYTRVN